MRIDPIPLDALRRPPRGLGRAAARAGFLALALGLAGGLCDASGAAAAGDPAGDEDPPGLSVLFVGNSLTAWNALGSYLAALVIFERLTGRDPRQLPPRIETADRTVDLVPDLARELQRVAADVATEDIPPPPAHR